MTTPSIIGLRFNPFPNGEGFIKVSRALCKLDGVELLAVDFETGKFTIRTTKDPQDMLYDLRRKFPVENIILSQEINRSYPTPVPLLALAPGSGDFAKVLETISQVKGLKSVEYTQSNTLKVYFTNQSTLSSSPTTPHNLPGSSGVHHEDAPPPPPTNVTPSAPPIPTTPDPFYTLHNRGPSGSHPEDGPPMQPPLQTYNTPMPQNYFTPSAPPIPTTPDMVYGYPPEFFGSNNDHPNFFFVFVCVFIVIYLYLKTFKV